MIAGLFARLFGRPRRAATDASPPSSAAPAPGGPAGAATPDGGEAPVAPAGASDARADEAWLAGLVGELAGGRRAAARIVLAEVAARIDALVAAGHDRLAAEWLDKVVASAATAGGAATTADTAPGAEALDELRARAVALRAGRGELGDALAHLEALTRRPRHAARAHFLLGEHLRRIGDDRGALRHLEACLALDLDHPNARVRAEALRQALGTTLHRADETVAGPDQRGAAGSRYRIVRELGRGAAGAVYLARDADLERDVAVKLLHAHLASGARADARALFFAEARVAASLRHPCVVAILDLDEREGRIVMELCAGGTLRDRLRTGPLPPGVALERHVEVLSALAAAHRRGVVHRDLKPANLLFRRDPDRPRTEVVLADFGIAHLTDAPAAGSPAGPPTPSAPPVPALPPREPAAEALGTLPYMAPEQRRGEAVTPAVDLFAAAVVLYEMLVGRLPWDHETMLRGARAVDDLRLPPTVRESVGAALAGRLEAHLASLGDPDPARRPATLDALAEARRLVAALDER